MTTVDRARSSLAPISTYKMNHRHQSGIMNSTSVFHAGGHPSQDRRQVEQHLARALRDVGSAPQALPEKFLDDNTSSRELLQLAWDRAQQEIDELQAELRLLRQRHQEAERRLLARINQRKRLQQTMLESACEPEAGVEIPAAR